MEDRWLEDIQSEDPEVRRQTIIALAESGEKQALNVLKWAYENDPDPALRNFSRVAGQHLWQKIKGDEKLAKTRQSQKMESAEPEEGESLQADNETPEEDTVEDGDAPGQSSRELTEEDINAARVRFDRALSLHLNEDTENAILTLSRALEIHPGLIHEDEVVANLAQELTGLPPEEALQRLLDEEQREALIAEMQQDTDQSARKGPPLSLYLLFIALFALAGLTYNFVKAGNLRRYQTWFTMNASSRFRHTAGGRTYYLVPPRGGKPPEGWPVVVGLHGQGGKGQDMLHIANRFTNKGVVYVAPTFGGYEPYPGAGPIEPMVRILEDVNQQYPIHSRGVVLLGFSQGGSFAYRFSVYHPEWVAGVVTAGAPELDNIAPARANIPYLFTWGEKDGLQDYVLPESVYPLVDRGYNIKYQIIEGAGHEITPFAIQQALEMADF